MENNGIHQSSQQMDNLCAQPGASNNVIKHVFRKVKSISGRRRITHSARCPIGKGGTFPDPRVAHYHEWFFDLSGWSSLAVEVKFLE